MAKSKQTFSTRPLARFLIERKMHVAILILYTTRSQASLKVFCACEWRPEKNEPAEKFECD